MSRNEDKEAFIPLPNFSGLISRNIDKQQVKWKLRCYLLDEKMRNPNFGLIYSLLPDNYVPDNYLPPNKNERDNLKKALESNKFNWLKTILNFQPSKEIVPVKLLPDIFKKIEVEATTDQPLIVGLGEASPYETGITLDFLTGLPVIPGSALKGITRRAAIMKLSDKTDILPYGEEFEKLAKEYDNHHEITEIFGTQDKKGKVIFMDAYPVNWPDGKLFRLDVMNPHYGPYYENPSKNPPADWYNPVPIFYLTVNTNVKYRFMLASENENLLKKALDWLKFALTNIGIGAKGNQGYGIFKIEIERKA